MHEHLKIVLNGVSDSAQLFKKELQKSLSWLPVNEKEEFKAWVIETYNHTYPDIIRETFNN